MSARQEIVDLLAAALPAWDVLPYVRSLGNLTTPTLMVETTSINHGPTFGLWSCTTSVYVVAPYEEFPAAEDMLEDGVVTVLNTLVDLPNVSVGANRVVLEEKHHAYQAQITYPLRRNQED